MSSTHCSLAFRKVRIAVRTEMATDSQWWAVVGRKSNIGVSSLSPNSTAPTTVISAL